MRHPVVAVLSNAGGTSNTPTTTCQLISASKFSKVASSTRNSTNSSNPVHAVSRALPAGPPLPGTTASDRRSRPVASATVACAHCRTLTRYPFFG